MIIKGRAYKFGSDINTDDIIAAKYLDSQDSKFLGSKSPLVLNVYSELPSVTSYTNILPYESVV